MHRFVTDSEIRFGAVIIAWNTFQRSKNQCSRSFSFRFTEGAALLPSGVLGVLLLPVRDAHDVYRVDDHVHASEEVSCSTIKHMGCAATHELLVGATGNPCV